jgi:hypothetical protein
MRIAPPIVLIHDLWLTPPTTRSNGRTDVAGPAETARADTKVTT